MIDLTALLAVTAMVAAAGCESMTLTQVGRAIVEVPAGPFLAGSTAADRSAALENAFVENGDAYRDAYQWLAQEREQEKRSTGAFAVMARPVTQGDYWQYVRVTGRAEPYVDPQTWSRLHPELPYALAQRHIWRKGRPSSTQMRLPVVLVSAVQAERYCAWWGELFDARGALPVEDEWEKSARGQTDFYYPWGNEFDSRRANLARDQQAKLSLVRAYEAGKSPLGVVDLSGNVAEWTASESTTGERIVKGGSYHTPSMTGRVAARSYHVAGDRHPSLGFRCVLHRD